ncbi:MAG: exodeoxyribonuclease V subunit gamma [Gammaproteobacteria bacterium]|nr:exodeoxyribonuclease V subunit gamma [Gammaproteobacteria bacterium]
MPQDTPIQPGFIVLYGNRLEDLREVTLTWLARHPLAPLEDDVLLVQSNGIAEWLQLSMAAYPDEGDLSGWGIAFGIETLLPAQFQWQAYQSILATADQELPKQSLFDKQRLRWRLMQLLPEQLGHPAFAPLAHYLGDDTDQRKRFQLAQRLADLYDQYQVYRADWLNAWANGRNSCPQQFGGAGELPDDQLWQAELWRTILGTAPSALQGSHRAAIHQAFMAQVQKLTYEQRPAALPRRVVVFGVSALPQQTLQVLGAIAHLTQVVICLVNPCRHYWGDIVEDRILLRNQVKRLARKDGMPDERDAVELHLHGHPLLAAWGKQGRDYIHMVDEHDDPGTYRDDFEAERLSIDLYQDPDASHLLGQLQADILDLTPLDRTGQRRGVSNDDDSIVFHIAHSRQREVEILHDQLLAAFEADPTLRPRDIMVMVPDIHAFAPAIQAVFGQFDVDDPRRIPFHVTDQLQRHQEPMVIALETLLRLPQLRFQVSEVMDLLHVPAIRHRFGIDEADLPTLKRWVGNANIRWGLNEQQRAELELGDAGERNSWKFGLDRMLLGYAVGEPELDAEDWSEIVPFGEVAGLNAALAGPLDRLLETLSKHRTRLQDSWRPAEWVVFLQALIEDFFLASDLHEGRLLGQLQDSLDAWLAECEVAGFDQALPLAVVRDNWLDSLDAPRLSQRFFGGAVTFATLMPMRAIPFRQICLLGMTDADYPRQSVRQDFDLMSQPGHYRPGDRSRREDDRYLFLEALLSARDRLYISWTGRNVRDNSSITPSVLVDQLRDHIGSGWHLETAGTERAAAPRVENQKAGVELLTALTTVHPLQPFSPDYFRPESAAATSTDLAARRRFTYAREWEAVAANSADGSSEAAAFARPLLPWCPEHPIKLMHLRQLLRSPANVLFRERLKIRFPDDSSDVDSDTEPFAISDALDRWQMIDALLKPISRRLFMSPETETSKLLKRLNCQRLRAGTYPAAAFGKIDAQALEEDIRDSLERLGDRLREYPIAETPSPAASHSIEQRKGNEPIRLALEDELDQVRCNAAGQRARIVVEASKLTSGKKDETRWTVLARHWPAHLALQLSHPDTPTHIVGPENDLSLAGLAAEDARSLLDDLLEGWLQAAQRPIPLNDGLGCDIAEKYFDIVRKDPGADARARADRDELLKSYDDDKIDKLLKRNPAIARICRDGEELLAWPTLIDDALALYLPLIEHVESTPDLEQDQ